MVTLEKIICTQTSTNPMRRCHFYFKQIESNFFTASRRDVHHSLQRCVESHASVIPIIALGIAKSRS